MSSSVEVMSSALDEFFKDQASIGGKCLVDYVQFGTHYDKVYEDRDISEAKARFNIAGMTALLDAVGRGTDELGAKLSNMKEAHRPGKVLVVVVTDGYENSSVEYSADKVKALITKQQDVYGWDYVFLGANIDAVATGALYGFKAGKSLTFNIHDSHAVAATSASLSGYTTIYRGGGNAGFSDSDRAAANKS